MGCLNEALWPLKRDNLLRTSPPEFFTLPHVYSFMSRNLSHILLTIIAPTRLVFGRNLTRRECDVATRFLTELCQG